MFAYLPKMSVRSYHSYLLSAFFYCFFSLVGFAQNPVSDCEGVDAPVFVSFNIDTLFLLNDILVGPDTVDVNCYNHPDSTVLFHAVFYWSSVPLSPDTIIQLALNGVEPISSNLETGNIYAETYIINPFEFPIELGRPFTNAAVYDWPSPEQEAYCYMGGIFIEDVDEYGYITIYENKVYGAIPIVRKDLFTFSYDCIPQTTDTCGIEVSLGTGEVTWTLDFVDSTNFPLTVFLTNYVDIQLDTVISELGPISFNTSSFLANGQIEVIDTLGIYYHSYEDIHCTFVEETINIIGGLNVDTVVFCALSLQNEVEIEPCLYLNNPTVNEYPVPIVYWSPVLLPTDTAIHEDDVAILGEFTETGYHYPLIPNQNYTSQFVDDFFNVEFNSGYFYLGTQVHNQEYVLGYPVSVPTNGDEKIYGATPVIFTTPDDVFDIEIIDFTCNKSQLDCSGAVLQDATVSDIILSFPFDFDEYHVQIVDVPFGLPSTIVWDSTLSNIDTLVGPFTGNRLEMKIRVESLSCGEITVEKNMYCGANLQYSGMELVNNVTYNLCDETEFVQIETNCIELSNEEDMFTAYALIPYYVYSFWLNNGYFDLTYSLNSTLDDLILNEFYEINTSGQFNYNPNYINSDGEPYVAIGFTGWGNPLAPQVNIDRIFVGPVINFYEPIEVETDNLIDFEFICYGDCYMLNYDTDLNYDFAWTDDNGTVFEGNNIEVCPEINTGYQLQISNEGGCIANDSMTVFVTTDATLYINGKASLIMYCGSSVLLEATPGYTTYEWNTGETDIEIVASSQPGYAYYSVTAWAGFDCYYETSIQTYRDTACVLPGDANHNGIVNHYDLLPIALTLGESGKERWNATNEWVEQPCEDWDDTYLNGINYKHADCDGNNIIDLDDLELMFQHYNLGVPTSETLSPLSVNGVPLYVEMPNEPLSPNQEITLPIVLGNLEEINAYALAFEIAFDSDIIETASIEINWSEGWLENPSELLTYEEKEEGKLTIAVGKTTQINSVGNGPIAHLRFTVSVDLPTQTTLPFTLEIKDPLVVNAEGEIIEIALVNNAGLLIGLNNLETVETPFFDTINQQIICSNGTKIEKIYVYDTNGKTIMKGNAQQLNSQAFSLNALPSGIYFLYIQSETNVYSQKIHLIH